jgi:hypothetical protein
MQSLLLLIHDLECHKEKNIKYHYQLMASTIWEFGLKIAEKFFLYNEDAQEYAKKILFMDLHNPFEVTLKQIKDDFITNQIPYDDAEIYNLFVDAHQKSKENITKKENIYL